jgi:hypothetical protein
VNQQFQEYVDAPNETLDVEYKSWLDLVDNNEARADLARHICAMANHGGGVIVFGFNDGDLSYAGPNKHPKVIFTRDLISGIAKRYLEPAPQCDLFILKSAAGNDHPVVVVPPHGVAPVCAKAGGPEVNGKPQGIVFGTHYTRKTGPASAAVTSSADWAPIIRRCAMADRSAVLASISAALHGASQSASPDTSVKLKSWHEAARKAFLASIANRQEFEQATKAYWQASYAIETSDGEKLSHGELVETLRQINNEVHDLVRTGWSMFHPFTRPEIAPVFATDPAVGEEDFLECAMARDTRPVFHQADFWRVSTDGLATIVRPHWEDDPAYARYGKAVGSFLSPQLQARQVAEVVRHARGLSERFNSPTIVHFRIEWTGLARREIYHVMGTWLPGNVSSQDQRVVTSSVPATDLAGQWLNVVATLTAPVIRLFMTHWSMDQQWVRNQQPAWLR